MGQLKISGPVAATVRTTAPIVRFEPISVYGATSRTATNEKVHKRSPWH